MLIKLKNIQHCLYFPVIVKNEQFLNYHLFMSHVHLNLKIKQKNNYKINVLIA